MTPPPPGPSWKRTPLLLLQDNIGPVLKPQVDTVAALLSWICIVAGEQWRHSPSQTAGARPAAEL